MKVLNNEAVLLLWIDNYEENDDKNPPKHRSEWYLILINTYTNTHTRAHPPAHTHAHAHTHTHTHTLMSVCVVYVWCVCAYTTKYTHTHIHKHTYTHTHKPTWVCDISTKLMYVRVFVCVLVCVRVCVFVHVLLSNKYHIKRCFSKLFHLCPHKLIVLLLKLSWRFLWWIRKVAQMGFCLAALNSWFIKVNDMI